MRTTTKGAYELSLKSLKNDNLLYDIDVIKHMSNSTDNSEKVRIALAKLRLERYSKLYNEIADTVSTDKDFELMVDQVQQIIIKTKLKLTHHELIAITDLFYKDKSIDLTLADKFFMEVDHANNQILNGKGVGMFYA